MTTDPRPGLHLVVGYDGSPSANRALADADGLLQGRAGDINVVYVAQSPGLAALSPGGAAELETSFNELEQDLRAQATEQLRAGGAAWEFHRREGTVAPELIATAAAVGEAHPNDTVAIIVGSSSTAARIWSGRSPCTWSATLR